MVLGTCGIVKTGQCHPHCPQSVSRVGIVETKRRLAAVGRLAIKFGTNKEQTARCFCRRCPSSLYATKPLEETNLLQIHRISFDNLRGILKHKSLVKFTIDHTFPIEMTQDDITEIATKWPTLSHLYLNPHPLVCLPPTLTLSALIPFAGHCPRLTDLGLYMDATQPIPPLPSNLLYKTPSLYVGGSSIPVDDASACRKIAEYLCELVVPSETVDLTDYLLSYDELTDGWLNDAAGSPNLAGYASSWATVETMMSMIFSLTRSRR